MFTPSSRDYSTYPRGVSLTKNGCLGELFLHSGSQAWETSESPGGLGKIQTTRPTPSFWFSNFKVGSRMFISKKSADDADAAGLGPH